MDNNYLGLNDAANYIGITKEYLKNKCRTGQSGPKFYRPSTRKTMFLRSDLDAWVKSWMTRTDAVK
jgi:hypothetical protein